MNNGIALICVLNIYIIEYYVLKAINYTEIELMIFYEKH